MFSVLIIVLNRKLNYPVQSVEAVNQLTHITRRSIPLAGQLGELPRHTRASMADTQRAPAKQKAAPGSSVPLAFLGHISRSSSPRPVSVACPGGLPQSRSSLRQWPARWYSAAGRRTRRDRRPGSCHNWLHLPRRSSRAALGIALDLAQGIQTSGFSGLRPKRSCGRLRQPRRHWLLKL